ncbi:MAG TPA: pre-peptidase C-terminal domain-containing protein [Thermoanaerobaculia bacterium]|nr:pre-peptidase C-terminal domain-containing protein [Thermoanaerobaculia bacterium]
MTLRLRFSVMLLALLFSAFSLLASDLNYEDCHSGFAAYLAASPYILNPASTGRAETKIVVVFEHAGGKTYGAVPYRMEILSAATGRVVYARDGGSDLELGTPLEATFRWEGVDQKGRPVPDGEYRIRMTSQLFIGERWASRPTFIPNFTENENGSLDGSGDTIFNSRGSEIRVVVDRAGKFDGLFSSTSKVGAQVQRASLDPSFPYNFFFGTTHAHSNWSDGGMPVTDCASGRYGYAGGAQPVDAFNYAKTTGGLDYIAVVEHNHLMAEACAGCTDAQVLSRYAAGFQAAQTATVAGSFVGLFGMEWGVISGGGHINVYNQSKLIAWTGEPADVLVTKSVYSELYTAMKNNQGTLGSYGSFCHPNSTDYNSYARTADGDAVVRGLAIISGPAFSTSTTLTPGGSTYVDQYNRALSFGWKVAPEAHQDNHCQTYGTSTPNRTVVVVPTTTTFNQQSLMAAYNGRHFFASQDRDAQLVYRTSDGAHVMGDLFNASAAVGITVGVFDPASEGVQKIEIWSGKVGTQAAPGAAAAVEASNLSATTLTASLAPRTVGEEWYYYTIATQADGDNIWSAPIWITWGSGGGCTLPTAPSLSSPAAGATNVAISTSLSWAAVSGATSYDVYFAAGSTPAFYQNATGTSVAVSGLQNSATYSWYVVAKNSCGASPAAATRSFTTVAASTGTPTITCGQSISGSLATTDPKSTVRTTSYADTYNFSGTSGSTVTITLTSTAFDTYAVLKNAAGTVLAQDDDGNGGTNSKIVFTLTASGTYSIEATSYAASTTGAYTITLACSTPSTVVTVLSEGAESGATGWTFAANTGSGWSNETSTDSHTGSHRFRTNAAYTTYVNNADWSVTSPAFSLSGKTAATLTYYYKFSTESAYDFFIVEVSKDGGTTWTQLSKSSGKSTGYSAWATQASVSLTPYAGNASCKVRFRLTSDTSVADWGAAVDDIVITAQ